MRMTTAYRKGSLGYAISHEKRPNPIIIAKTNTTPLDVVHFLARSWSSFSLQAFHTISRSLECELDLKTEGEESDKKDIQGNCRGTQASCNRNVSPMVSSKPAWMQRLAEHLRQSWVDVIETSHAITWMRKKLGSSKGEARKEELRLHAAISVAGVAAAIAALSAKSAVGNAPDKKNLAISAAAALVAAQCAEAAELMGAQHQHVASVIRSAVSAATPTDLLALTAAAAATTLRVATRKRGVRRLGRANEHPAASPSSTQSIELDFAQNKATLARGTRLPTCVNGGKTQLKIIHVYAKQSHVVLRVRTKHLGGTFTTFKDYIVTEVARESMDSPDGTSFANEVNGYCSIHIKTRQGDVHITFKDREICCLWAGTISQLLFLSKKGEILKHSCSCTSQFLCM